VSKVIFDISMSLDGFVTASGVRPEEPMGDGGQKLHEWAHGDDEKGNEVLAESQGDFGASIAGRRTYDTSLPWWGADGPEGSVRTPTFIVSHSEPDEVPEGSVHTFVGAWRRRSKRRPRWQAIAPGRPCGRDSHAPRPCAPRSRHPPVRGRRR
jgi:dihydrofolate reductase